ncbi:hypothetical protein IPC600_32005 [Pseudomonas aeruginosa]|nr:hypothetical protein F8132_32205 [Pseudomonas aeruginosa]RQC68479.1 hypothetical protein IPC353_32200 [Pseudomonas aeruginosa]RUI72663.1 hypothetical protein IPC412_30555 [Pseudomonas aeruginosa]RUJ26035.1 hypothetical protein IPC357_30550 [Pseudomonas aeruginosa]TEI41021.1 hypothetical protein IPC634_32300 [Pseudomonas aeruginosa]
MGLLRFLGLLFVFFSIFAGTAAVVGLAVLAMRLWPLLPTLIVALAIFHFSIRRRSSIRR